MNHFQISTEMCHFLNKKIQSKTSFSIWNLISISINFFYNHVTSMFIVSIKVMHAVSILLENVFTTKLMQRSFLFALRSFGSPRNLQTISLSFSTAFAFSAEFFLKHWGFLGVFPRDSFMYHGICFFWIQQRFHKSFRFNRRSLNRKK